MLAVYGCIALGIVTGNAVPFIICFVLWLFYICLACSSDTTSFIRNTQDVAQIFANIDAAILARPKCYLRIQNYHFSTGINRGGG